MPKIMIVEDNELNMKLFRDLLTSETYTVIETQDGKIAYELAKREKPNLILMDIQLQGISGYEIITRMKEDSEIKTIPIIAVTAFAMKDDEERILATGCDAYISKPISITTFMDTVQKYISEEITEQ